VSPLKKEDVTAKLVEAVGSKLSEIASGETAEAKPNPTPSPSPQRKRAQ
jgi:hypothetical protein